jgi:hypothetical protein
VITGAQVLIDSVDQSAKLTGTVQIDIGEGVARTASFTLVLSTGVSDIVGWTGKSVVIKSNIDSNLVTEFTGVIDTPTYDIESGLATFKCTDNLQEHFETKSKSEIDTLTPGAYWSEAVFNDSEGWEYTQERMSAIPASLDMDSSQSVRITDWAAKTTPDYTFNTSGFIHGSLKNPEYANRRNIINAVDLELEYRYTRLKERQQAYSFDDGLTDAQFTCGMATNPYPMPTKARVLSAIEGTGWEITVEPTWSTITVGGPHSPCGIYQYANPFLVRGVDFTIGRRYAQAVTEKYTIHIESADSIAAFGEVAISQSASEETIYDTSTWNASLIADGWSGFGTPATDVNSDKYVNKDNDTTRQNALNTAINVAKTKILASHRNNSVSFDIPYHQVLDVIHTGQISSSKLTAKGKVSRVLKQINTLTGEAVCAVTLKLSKKFGTGTPTADDLPSTPDGLPSSTDTQTVDLDLEWHLGGQDSTEYDEDWSGWIADYYSVTEPGHTPYPTEFVVHTPAITLNSIDNIEPSDSSHVNVTIPDDTLS